MKIRIKKLSPYAVIPQYAKPGDAGMDLVATSKEIDQFGNMVYGTGLAFEIPEGYVGLLFPRSSNSKKNLWLTNHVGVLDSGYRGEVTFKFRATFSHIETDNIGETVFYNTKGQEYNVGDRIGQIIIIPYPKIEFELAAELSETERGEGGYGSTGK